MAKQTMPSVAGRGLGGELRQLRRTMRLKGSSVAVQLGWQPSKLSRIETGQQGVRAEEVAALLTVYGVVGEERKRLLSMAERSRDKGWWETHGAGLTAWSRTFNLLEAEATRVVTWQPLLVPGLLQLPEYTSALMKSCGVSPAEAESRVAARLARQAILARDEPPELHAIIDETVLRRPLGSHQLMVRQLRHLIELSERPNVSLQVVPLARGGHTGLDGGFVLFDFRRRPSVVHLEHKISGVFLEEPEQVAVFRRAADALTGVSLSPADSTDVVARTAAEHERGGVPDGHA
ncbi:helix-turn-helix transcriptional regulator [Micromonospora sp. WMMD975]|uniref:helix-turn-helix domain-containing protein n=1 Tax=Micromonospora sp. WMMD975 TaxID=3016087 RepID=UPI00249C2A8E|nr:helix-turn-helix transcriptional regulator [Micromonospora sp. WMMD975]WFE33269.1 helix-turn-helix transcriptional regulator [Micromonospora sp. WMMD975]